MYFDFRKNDVLFYLYSTFYFTYTQEGKTLSVRITGYDEIFGRSDYISIDSPMACALLKKEVDDEAIVMTPEGEKVWQINSITYDKDTNT